MKVKIQRFCKHREPENAILVDYEVPMENVTLLESLTYIKTKIDPTLTFQVVVKVKFVEVVQFV